jgi:DNA (cytosine-5)-methyltransferase 1
MKFGSLFAGIGGFDLGLERAGMECAWQVEIDDFCNRVLEKHWPDVRRHRDVREVGKHNLKPVDLICGGFPCQPFSVAGKRAGKEDDRHLWPEMFRIIQELKPHWVIGENVGGFINMGLDESISDLEGEGYEVQAFVIPACAVNAPHRRDRVWIVANSISRGCGTGRERMGVEAVCRGGENDTLQTSESNSHGPNPSCELSYGSERTRTGGAEHTDGGGVDSGTKHATASRQRRDGRKILRITEPEGLNLYGGPSQWNENWIEVAARLCRVDDGVSERVDRLKSLGNAVVPKIVEIIGRAIMNIEQGKDI